jgi:hypothetical protein
VFLSLKSKIFYLYAILVIIYSSLTLTSAAHQPSLAKYHISLAQLRWLDLSFIIPLAVIWFVAFYGFTALKQYSQKIQNNKDGREVARIANGLMVLGIGMPITSIVSALSGYAIRRFTGAHVAVDVIDNYISLLVPLLAFSWINRGTYGLSESIGRRISRPASQLLAVSLIVIGVFYVYLATTSHVNLHDTYHLPFTLVLLTQIAPYLYVWYLGLRSVHEIFLYRRQAAGIVYRDTWGSVAWGLGLIILASIALQYLTTIPGRLSAMPLAHLLLMIYVLLVWLGAGFVLIARGAKKLQKIEEV